jgi:hypothetical protein
MNRKKFNLLRLLPLLLLSAALFSCQKDDNPALPSEKMVMILNQGNFTEQSGSISLYDETSQTLTNRAYETANGGISLGATLISGWVDDSKKAYLVCNYADKIVTVDAKTAVISSPAITSNLSNPRAICGNGNYLFVSNWGTDYVVNENYFYEYINSYIAIFDAVTHAFVKSVPVGTDAEGVLIDGNYLYVATKEGVVVINTANSTFPIVKTIRHASVTGSAKNLALDKDNKIWASFPDKGLVKIDPSLQTATGYIEVPVDAMDGYICTDGDGSRILTYITEYNSSWMPEKATIYAVNTTTGAISSLYEGTYFYGVGASTATGNIFTAEVSFSSNSILKVLGSDGTLLKSATAGVGTSRYLSF